MLVRVKDAPRGLPYSKVYLAYPKDAAEHEEVGRLEGWTWHHARETASQCPAALVGEGDVFWATDADVAAQIDGPGVWLATQRAQLQQDLQKSAPQIVWEPAWRRFVVKRPSKLFRSRLTRAGGWKFHGGQCSPDKCPSGCPLRGLYGYHTAYQRSVEPFLDYLSKEAKEELARRAEMKVRSRREDEDGVAIETRGDRELRPYQRAGVRWALDTPRCLIGDEPGLGKTPQAIGTVLSLSLEEAPAVLVVCPAGVSSNWRFEIGAWSAEKHRIVVLSSAQSVDSLVAERTLEVVPGERLWVISSYDTLRRSPPGQIDERAVLEPPLELSAPGSAFCELGALRSAPVPDAPAKTRRKKGSPPVTKCERLKKSECKVLKERKKPQRGQRGDLLASLPPFPVLVLDEAHRLSGPSTQQTQAAAFHAARARRVIAMTGTPMPNDVLDMQPVLAMLEPMVFERKSFSHRFCLWKDNGFGAAPYGMNVERAAEFQELLRSTVMIRRRKQDVLKELPPKVYRTVVLQPTPEVNKLIAAQRAQQLLLDKSIASARQQRLDAEASGNSEAMLSAINAELDATAIVFERASQDRQRLGVAKIKDSLRYIEERAEDGRKIIVFVSHLDVAHALYQGLGAEQTAILLVGAVDAARRGELVSRFQQDPSVKFAVATIASSAEGITLTAAHTVVFVEFPWTSVAISQCEDRAHRFTQKHTVEIDYLVFDGSMDATIAGLIATKAKYARLGLDAKEEPSLPVAAEVPQGHLFASHSASHKRFTLGGGRPKLAERLDPGALLELEKKRLERARKPRSMLEMLACEALGKIERAWWTEEIAAMFR